MLMPDRLRLRSRITSAECRGVLWFLPIFVTILCTNLPGPTYVLASDGPLTPVAAITKSMEHQTVTVQAVVSNVREPRAPGAPYTVTLVERGATIPLICWTDVYVQLAPRVRAGNLIRVDATVGIYRDQLQLQIRDADAVTVVTGTAIAPAVSNPSPAPAASPTPTASSSPPTETLIGKITADWTDRVVIISGTVSSSGTTDKGPRLSVQDRTGEMQVVLGEKALVGLVVAELQPGRALTITGPVKMSDGKLAIVPEVSADIKLGPL